MAWRIHDQVKRGVIDNRERGRVRGELWLDGLSQPVILDLLGNAQSDLAGCLLTFENPGPTKPMRADALLNLLQQGTVGDLTASRKVRVLEMPIEEAYPRKKAGLPVPEHLANCLYLEWFSEANGRVVIESTGYHLTISPPSWRLTPEEERKRRQEVEGGMLGFMTQLGETLNAEQSQAAQETALTPEGKEENEAGHPLLARAQKGLAELERKCATRGLASRRDGDLKLLLDHYRKLAAELVRVFEKPAPRPGSSTVVCLQRALEHLRAAQATLEKIGPKNLLSAEAAAFVRAEFLALRGEVLQEIENQGRR